jgi:flagellar hook-length control protein FliK
VHAARESREKPDAIAVETSHSATEWQGAVERVQAPVETQARNETPGIAALGAAAPTAGAQRAEAAAAPVAATVATPVTAPEFAQSLGVQVSVLARDGIQQAELHLNPAEMGPISVQIALDGTQAQVNFGADSAATRAIIEGGLPELAAALRDAGFTLSGGGVHSQARGQGEGGDTQGGDARGGTSSETEVTPQRVNAHVSAGGVDVYA